MRAPPGAATRPRAERFTPASFEAKWRDRWAADRLDHADDGDPREKRYIRKDGRVIWVMVSGSVIRDASGNLSSMIATIADVTSRRLAEESVREKG